MSQGGADESDPVTQTTLASEKSEDSRAEDDDVTTSDGPLSFPNTTKIALDEIRTSVNLVNGWNPDAGGPEEQQLCFSYFYITEAPSVEDQERWYFESPWNWAIIPKKYKVKSVEALKSEDGKSSTPKGTSVLAKPAVMFDVDNYYERLVVPLLGETITRWIVCCYISPVARIVKIVEGHLNKSEKDFPYAIQTLRMFCGDQNLEIPKPEGEELIVVHGGKPYFVFDLKSHVRGNMRVTLNEVPFKRFKEIGDGFWNVRTSFKVFGGIVDIGNHMSLLRLTSGKWLAIDAVDPATFNGDVKREIDRLTRGGRLIEAVIATHPFHTLGFPAFHAAYPNAKYYGTPRHLRVQPHIPWAGSVGDLCVRRLWEPEVEMRIPDGSEFNDPRPPMSNHFSNVFVFHRLSRAIHNDDCLCYFDNPIQKMGVLVAALGVRHDQLSFHNSMEGPGLFPTEESPQQFAEWCGKLVDDWDFCHLCTAHNGNCKGNARERLRTLLAESGPKFAKIASRNAKRGLTEGEISAGAWDEDGKNCECG